MDYQWIRNTKVYNPAHKLHGGTKFFNLLTNGY